VLIGFYWLDFLFELYNFGAGFDGLEYLSKIASIFFKYTIPYL
jgi:hypothetical protein